MPDLRVKLHLFLQNWLSSKSIESESSKAQPERPIIISALPGTEIEPCQAQKSVFTYLGWLEGVFAGNDNIDNESTASVARIGLK